MGNKVVKFGGSSLADANQFVKVANIIKSDSRRKYVVPSAPGKRFSDDIKVTDMLYTCAELAGSGVDFSEAFDKITERYNGIIKDLGLDFHAALGFDLFGDLKSDSQSVAELNGTHKLGKLTDIEAAFTGKSCAQGCRNKTAGQHTMRNALMKALLF